MCDSRHSTSSEKFQARSPYEQQQSDDATITIDDTDALVLAPISSWLTNEGEFFDTLNTAYRADPNIQTSRRFKVYQQDQGHWYVPAYFNQHGGASISAQDTRRLRVVPQFNEQPMWNGRLLVLPSNKLLLSKPIKEAHDASVSGHHGCGPNTCMTSASFLESKAGSLGTGLYPYL